MPPTEPTITLLTRVNCHLCEDAQAALARVHEATGVPWSTIDVDSDADLAGEYGDRVPVVLLDGKEHGYWRVEEDRLLRDLAR